VIFKAFVFTLIVAMAAINFFAAGVNRKNHPKLAFFNLLTGVALTYLGMVVP